MIHIEYRVKTSDGHGNDREVETVAGPAEVIRLEREFGIAASELSERANAKFMFQAYMAWQSLRRRHSGEWPDTFEGFLDILEDLEVKTDTSERVEKLRPHRDALAGLLVDVGLEPDDVTACLRDLGVGEEDGAEGEGEPAVTAGAAPPG